MKVENYYDKDGPQRRLGVARNVGPEASEMVIEFGGRLVPYSFGHSTRWLAYATTIYKSQGSEYPASSSR